MKFHKATETNNSIAIFDEGEFETTELGATVSYKFDHNDHSLRLTIDDMWFESSDVSELIDFLTFAKTQLTK